MMCALSRSGCKIADLDTPVAKKTFVRRLKRSSLAIKYSWRSARMRTSVSLADLKTTLITMSSTDLVD